MKVEDLEESVLWVVVGYREWVRYRVWGKG
jgi:hypothetical protein